MSSYYTDPAQQFFLQLSQNQAQKNQSYYEQMGADPRLVNDLIQHSLANPTASAELNLALAQGGIAPGDPLADFAAQQELAVRSNMGAVENPGGGWWDDLTGVVDEWVTNPVQGAVRWGFAAWDAAYNLAAGGAPIRARQLAQEEGMEFDEAWAEQDPYFFEALGGLFAGEKVNLGSGWFPQSDVTDGVRQSVNEQMMTLEQETNSLSPNERYRTRLEAAPGIWTEAVRQDAQAQAALGKPLTQFHDAQAESVMFEINDLYGNKRYTPWSPGRIAAAHITEPGTQSFKIVSGVGDFTSQLVADPVEWLGLGWAKAGRRSRLVWAEGKKIAKEMQQYESAAQRAGRVLGTGEPTPQMVSADPTRRLALGMGAQTSVNRPRLIPESRMTGTEPRRTPWWLSPAETSRRVTSAFDPPQWYIDQVRRVKGDAADTADVAAQKPRRKLAGVYELDMPRIPGQKQQTVRVQRQGKGRNQYWEVVMPDGSRASTLPDDPRFSEAKTKFRTLDEATTAAKRAMTGNFDERAKVHGMSVDEFLDSAEEFAVSDPRRLLGLSETSPRTPGKPTAHRARHAGTKKKAQKGKLSNARVMVFGKTIDLTDATVVSDLPAKLQDAVRADHKVRGDRIVGWGDESMDNWDNTMRWMSENGYGKLKWDDDTTLINDDFIGGDRDAFDMQARAFFPAGDQPMYLYRAPMDDMAPPTPNEVNELFEFVATSGRMDTPITQFDTPAGLQGEGFTIPGMVPEHPGIPGEAIDVVNPRAQAVAERIRTAAAKEAHDGRLAGVRPDVDPAFRLNGKKADKLLDKMVAASRTGGQASTAMLDDLLDSFRSQGVRVPNEIRTALFEAQTKDEIQYIFSKWMIDGQVPELLLPGGTQFGRLATVTGGRSVNIGLSDKSWFARRMAKSIGDREVNVVEDPSAFYELVLDAMPHYNLSRGQEIARYDPKTGVQLEGTIKIEEILDEIRSLPANHKPAAYGVMRRLNEALFSSLVGEGVDPRLASEVSRWWRESGEMALYDAERFGKPFLDAGADSTMIVNDATLGGLGPQLSADLWTGNLTLPQPRVLKRAVNESDLVGRIANDIAAKTKVTREGTDLRIGGMDFDDRVWYAYATGVMNKVWKPFVLLRGAWTLRILMDDQMRMLADGYSMFNHPTRIFNYALSMSKDTRTAFAKGYVDINGVRFSTKNVDEMKHSQIYTDAMMKKRDAKVGRGAYGYRQHTPVPKGHPRYSEGMVFEMQHLNGSVTTKVLAGSTSESPVEETVRWLSGNGRSGLPDPSSERANLAELYRDTPDVAKKILDGDQATITDVVNRQWAILHHRLGGDVVLDTGRGQHLDFTKLAKVDDVEPTGGAAKWVIRQRGDEDLIRIVGSDEPAELSDAGVKELQKLINNKVANSKHFPQAVRGPLPVEQSGGKEGLMTKLGNASNGLMDFFMTLPSNKLSRSPEFSRAYWERMGQFLPYMDEGLKAKVLAQAPTSRMRELEKAAKRKLPSGDQYITDLDQVDMHAKAYALNRVDQTLFTLDEKRNISDSLNLVFPFVEAWAEFIERWGRLMVTGDKNVANLRRFQQVVEGARGSGFFHENDYGQEVFTYPAFLTQAGVKLHNTLNNIPGVSGVLGGDVSPEVAGSIESTGNVESLNFASGVIPGFGPVFQMAAKQFLPDDPKFDWMRDIIAPFGLSGGIANQFAPAWVKRLLSANGGFDDPALTYTYNSTRMDVLRTMIDRGDFAGVTSQQDLQELIDAADREAQGVLMVRAAATFIDPASPSYTFQKQDEQGMVWSYSNLGNEFRKIQQEVGGDESAAFDVFFDRFGFLPTAFTGGKTYSVMDRSLTESGSKFERGNSELFNSYPSTAMYVDPSIAGQSEYDHEAMLSQLAKGLRENYTPEQFVYLQQDQMGDMWWDNVNKIAAGMNKNQRDAYLSGVRSEIQERFPYWNQPTPGKVAGYTNDQQMSEVQQMIADPSLMGNAAVEAARKYESGRQEVLEQLAVYGSSSIDGPSSTTTDAGKVATFGREWLRQLADELIIEYPQFGEMYRNVYSYEVANVHDAPKPPIIDVFGEGDIFGELGLAS